MTATFKPGARKSSSGADGKSRNVPWTDTEVERLLFLHDDGWGVEDIAVKLARTINAVTERIGRELHRRGREQGTARINGRVSDRQEHERQRRAEGYDARDLTGVAFGDPPRGFSALDQRGGA